MNNFKKNVSKTTGRIQFKTIRQKMITGFSAVIIFTVAIVAISITTSLKYNKKTDEVVDVMVADFADLKYLSQNFVEQTSIAHEYLLTEDSDRLDKFDSLTEENIETNARLKDRAADDDDEIDAFLEESLTWSSRMHKDVFQEVINGNKDLALTNLNDFKPETQRLIDMYTQAAIYHQDSITETGNELTSQQKTSLITIVALTVFVIILSVAIALLTAQSIATPVGLMRDRLNEFADNDFSSEELDVTTKDEIADLGNALNTTQRNLVNLTSNIKNSSEVIATNSKELALSGREVQSGADQITATMQELASGTEQQASSTVDLSESMNNFVETINETSRYGEDIQTESQTIASRAQQGNEQMSLSKNQMQIITDIVEQAVEEMEHLNNETNEIYNLVDIINGIAQQTNLLALNASIEAARAGEQGRGFAVVAEEVRTLAEEVGASVSEITRSIETVQKGSIKVASSLQSVNKEVDLGTVQIQETDEDLTEIMRGMEALREKNNQMATNLNQISENTVEINSEISEIASVSEESAAGVEETSAATEEINSSMDEITNKSDGLQDIARILDTLVNAIKI